MSDSKITSVPKDSGPFKIAGDWNAQSKALKEQYSQLTEADVKCETGKEEDLIDRMRTRLNMNREEVVTILRKGQPSRV